MAPKKYLGQHFLTAVSYAQRIAKSIDAQQGERVCEIGPGRGALSVHLRERFPDFHMVEIDPEVIPILTGNLGVGGWSLYRADVLTFDFSLVGFPLHCVGNLPYSIAALVIKKVLLLGNDVLSCTFMVQREVAERIVAAPHSKKNGFLTIFCQFFGRPKILFHIPPGAFFPKPAVDSSVFQLVIDKSIEQRLPRSRWGAYFSFVDRGFRMRRKMLVNVLGHGGNKEEYGRIISSMGIRPDVRPEDLGTEEWLELYKKTCDALH
jgi:16S rRNA (adenine1518-N6/adenine1519-N6)-dimethyltransferase